MIRPRAILSALVALAVAIAPIGAAWAGPAAPRGVEVAGGTHLAEAAGEPATDAMRDCASMKKGAAKSHPPCCAIDLACPPEFCIAKCFQLFDTALSMRVSLVDSIRPNALDEARPPDWSSRPQPPPPRT